jgi:acyl carrier protein
LQAADAQLLGVSPIGVRIPDLQLYVLDAQREPVPAGVIGELYVGGAGVARGYLNREALTAERFINDPFSENAQARLYKTGDLARWAADGSLEYLGRNDDQVKIRGFRIELGEIESRLQQCPGIREAVVLAVPLSGGLQLVAYVVSDPAVLQSAVTQTAFRQQIRAALQANLPDYMVPGHLLLLANLPLTPSGKLDRKALPAPDPSQLQGDYRPPQTDTEQQLAQIWAEVLQVARVGLDDHFFELGGHSLLAAQVIARIKTQLGVVLPLRSLFEKPLLGELAGVLAQLADSATNDDWSDMDQFMNALQGEEV